MTLICNFTSISFENKHTKFSKLKKSHLHSFLTKAIKDGHEGGGGCQRDLI
jgi:hypothetical protein